MSVIGFSLLMTIIFIILGIIGIRMMNSWYDIVNFIGTVVLTISILCIIMFASWSFSLIVSIVSLPVSERDFKVEYETVKQMQTSPSDLRDATYTQKILKINQKINEAREYCNDPFWGCINSKEIASYELLSKE